jgi:competence protein ComEC
MPDDTLLVPAGVLEASSPEVFVKACNEHPDHLLYFLLNVGDGDTQLLVLPAEEKTSDKPGLRRMIVVDVATTNKLPALIDALHIAGIVPDLDDSGLFPVVVASHPHDDHLGGMPQFLARFGNQVKDFWEPGYYHPSGAYLETMAALEIRREIDRMQPASGTVRFIGPVKITVLTPGVCLKNRFDTYGVDVNDSSISLKLSFPATRVAQIPTPSDKPDDRKYLRLDDPWSLLLGADAQTTAWAQATMDFPELKQENSAIAHELDAARGADHLQAQIVKMPHHASKHGVNIELIERIQPWTVLVSSVGGGGKYNFPHQLALEATREAIQPSTTTTTPHKLDYELGIHYTGGREDAGDGKTRPLGSIAIMIPPRRHSQPQLWRFMDEPEAEIVLDAARHMPYLRKL